MCALAWNCHASVLTFHNDLARTGQNLNETQLTPARVSSGQFGRLFSYPVDGQVYAQPLYLPSVTIPGKGVHNVVFVATEHDSIYAFDADSYSDPLWHISFLNFTEGVTTASSDDLECDSIVPEIGITGTPVIDPVSGTLYVVAMTEEGPGARYVHRLHALDVTTGLERPGSPVEIQASLPGTGDGNTRVRFQPELYKQRAGLLLLNGIVYTAWASHCDSGGYHGWIIGYNAKTLQQAAAYTDTPNWDAGSFWQGGAAPAADADGNIYVVSGNGTFDGDRGGVDLAQSVIKLSPARDLTVVDYFTPFDADILSLEDQDLGSSGALLLPEEAGSPAHRRLVICGSKSGTIYLLDRDRLGHFQTGSNSQIVQSVPAATGPVFGIPVYWNNRVFIAGAGDRLKAFSVTEGLLSSLPVAETADVLPAPGAVPSVSANGSSEGIVWIIDAAAQLRAFDATNLGNELYRGDTGSFVKFSTPTIADGKLFVGTTNSLVVFGLQERASGNVSAIVNAGGFQSGPVAPGSIVSLFGYNLASRIAGAAGAPWPFELGGSSVTVDALPAPLSYVSPAQINAQIPYEVSPGKASVIVSVGGAALAVKTLAIQSAAPGLFLVGENRAAVQNQDGAMNSPGHPAPAGSIVTAYLTGQGQLDQNMPVGTAAPAAPPIAPIAAISAELAGQPAEVVFTRLAPGLVGVLEAGIRIPPLDAGDYGLRLGVGGIMSNSALITVGGN